MAVLCARCKRLSDRSVEEAAVEHLEFVIHIVVCIIHQAYVYDFHLAAALSACSEEHARFVAAEGDCEICPDGLSHNESACGIEP